ncbi:MAG: tetratricopeptide repeat protein [Coleofasciculus sp. S288]|nr:tetratricopeptide repeat protein [Coleofasciculus sp. S288]
MDYLLPREGIIIQLYLKRCLVRIYRIHKLYKRQDTNLDKKRKFNKFLREELNSIKIAVLTSLKRILFRFSSKKNFLKSSTLSLLLIKYLDLDIITVLPQNNSLESDAYYRAARYYLEGYLLEEREISHENNIDRIEGYLQAFENLCEVQDWERANKIMSLYLDKAYLSLPILSKILITWGYEQRASTLYAKLWQYSDINDKDDYFIQLGNLFTGLLKYEEGIDCHKKALSIIQSKKNNKTKSKWELERECRCLNTLGQNYTTLGDYQSAVLCHRKALEIIIENKRKIGCWNKFKTEYWNKFWEKYSIFRSIFLLLNLVAICLVFAIGNPVLAQMLVPLFVLLMNSIPTSIGVSENILADTLNRLGYVYFKIEEYQTAIKCYEKALDEASSNKKNSSELIDSLCNVGDLYLRIEDSQNSINYYQKALQVVRGRILYNKQTQEGVVLQKLGSAYIFRKDYQKAEEQYAEALVCFQKSENRGREASILNCLGCLYFDLRKFNKAIEYYEQAILIYQQTEDYSNERIVRQNLDVASQYLGLAEAETIGTGLDRVEEIYTKVISPQQTSNLSPQALIEHYLQADSSELEPADIRKIEQALKSNTLDASMLAQGFILLRKEKGLDLVNNQLDWIYELACIADGSKPRYFLPSPKPTGRLASTAWMEALLKQGLLGEYSSRIAITLGAFGVFIPEMVSPL